MLAAVVLVAVAGLFKVSALKQLWRIDKTEFVVAAPPHEEAGVWKMTVDGVDLIRVNAGAALVEQPGSTST